MFFSGKLYKLFLHSRKSFWETARVGRGDRKNFLQLENIKDLIRRVVLFV